MRTRDLTASLRREITLPSHHRSRDEKQTLLALCNKIERAELLLRQLRREAQHALQLGPGRVVTSGTVRKVNADLEAELESRLAVILREAEERDAKGAGAPAVTTGGFLIAGQT